MPPNMINKLRREWLQENYSSCHSIGSNYEHCDVAVDRHHNSRKEKCYSHFEPIV